MSEYALYFSEYVSEPKQLHHRVPWPENEQIPFGAVGVLHHQGVLTLRGYASSRLRCEHCNSYIDILTNAVRILA